MKNIYFIDTYSKGKVIVSTQVAVVLKQYPDASRDKLIPILQDIQELDGFLSREAILEVGTHLNLPASKIFGVATFYNQFTFGPQGKFHIQVCRGTACHVKGSANILDALIKETGCEAGQTSADALFSIEVVACIGACGLAPVISVNGEFYAGMTTDKVKGIIAEYRGKAGE